MRAGLQGRTRTGEGKKKERECRGRRGRRRACFVISARLALRCPPGACATAGGVSRPLPWAPPASLSLVRPRPHHGSAFLISFLLPAAVCRPCTCSTPDSSPRARRPRPPHPPLPRPQRQGHITPSRSHQHPCDRLPAEARPPRRTAAAGHQTSLIKSHSVLSLERLPRDMLSRHSPAIFIVLLRLLAPL